MITKFNPSMSNQNPPMPLRVDEHTICNIIQSKYIWNHLGDNLGFYEGMLGPKALHYFAKQNKESLRWYE
jgi:hypothetical protein